MGGASPGDLGGLDEEYEYDVAVSFAGPQRSLAERLATLVKEAGFSVFYDNFYPDHLWGKDLPTFFDQIYREKARFCVLFISHEYVDRMWTNWERQSATTRLLRERGKEYVLPIIVEHVEVQGIPSTIGHLALDQYSIEQIAQMLIKKLTAARAHDLRADKPLPAKRSGVPGSVADGESAAPHALSGQEVTQFARTRLAGAMSPVRFSQEAKQVLEYVVRKGDPEGYLTYEDIERTVDLHGTQLDDALHELKDARLIAPHGGGGNTFSLVQPDVRGWEQVGERVLGYDMQGDMLNLARALNEHSPIDGPTLEQVTKLPIKRLNLAALALKAHARIKLIQPAGTQPYAFAEAEATYKTRQWLRSQQS